VIILSEAEVRYFKSFSKQARLYWDSGRGLEIKEKTRFYYKSVILYFLIY
jgi:hypothetical protein